MSTATELRPENWETVKAFLPEGWREKVQELGLLKFGRKFSGEEGAEKLLRTMLIHLAGNLSLRATCAIAAEANIVSVSDVALLKRFGRSAPFFNWASRQLMGRFAPAPTLTNLPPGGAYRWRFVDGSLVEEPGATGSNWRMHFALDAQTLMVQECVVHDLTVGESYGNFTIRPGDVLIGDRAYATRSGIAAVIKAGGHVLNRFSPNNLPIVDESGRRVDLASKLRHLKPGETSDFIFAFNHQGKRHELRICAIRKSEEAADRERDRIRKRAKKHGYKTVKAMSLEHAAYTLVATTLPVDITVTEILSIYRARWQIELLFKRLKSLLRISPLHKRSDSGMQGWLSGKLFVVMLIHYMRQYGERFSPWGIPLPEDD